MIKEIPSISIITVSYNSENTIGDTILSILNQTYNNIEYIIIDGASTDGTLEIIKRYDQLFAQRNIRYKYISEPDKGIYDAMNKGIGIAKGDWIFFIGAGDLLLNILVKVASYLNDANTIYYGNVYRNDLYRIYDGKYSAFKLAVTNICHQAIFYPSIAFKKYRYNIKYKIQADHELNMRCYGDENLKFKYLPILISIYEGDGYSVKNLDYPFFDDKMAITKKNFSAIVFYYAYMRRFIARFIKKPY